MLKIHFQLNEISRWYKPWFYEHVKSCLSKGGFEECIPLCDYYHRHTKSIFWELKVTFNLYHTFTGKTQYLGPKRVLYTTFEPLVSSKYCIVQTISCPVKVL